VNQHYQELETGRAFRDCIIVMININDDDPTFTSENIITRVSDFYPGRNIITRFRILSRL